MFSILLEKSAERDLKKLPNADFERMVKHIKLLAENPHPSNCRKIVGSENDWRIRVGDFRIIYEIATKEKIIKIMRIKHRREAYRQN